MATIFSAPYFTAQDAAGKPILGATLAFYASGTDTPAVVYAAADASTPLPQPIFTDAAGRAPTIYLDDATTYRLIVRNAAGVSIRDIDPVTAVVGGLQRDLATSSGAALVGAARTADGAVLRTVAAVLAERRPTPQDFGSVGDDVADDTAALAAWLACASTYGKLRLPRGTYRVSTPLVHTVDVANVWKTGGKSIAIEGDGPSCTAIHYVGSASDTVLRINGDFPEIIGFECSGFIIRRDDGPPSTIGTGIGLHLKDMLSFSVRGMNFFRHGVGAYLEGCLQGEIANSTMTYNDRGAVAQIGSGSSTPNIIKFSHCNFAACYTKGVSATGGTGVVLETCNFDGVGSTDNNGVGVELINLGSAGGVGLLFLGVNYFENIGGFGVYINHGDQAATYSLRNAVFNRFGGTTRTMTCVVFDANTLAPGTARALVDLGGCAFNAYSGWTASPAARVLTINAAAGYDGLTVADEGAQFQLATEVPDYPAAVRRISQDMRVAAKTRFGGAGATLSNAYNVASIARNGAGDYTFTFVRPVGTLNGCQFTALSSNCVAKITAETTSTVRIVTHVAGTATDTDGLLTLFGTAP